MVNNSYNFLGKDYAMGGIINGDIDNMVITGGQEADIWEFLLEDDYNIALSEKYGLFVLMESKTFTPTQVSQINVGQSVYVFTDVVFDAKKVISINKRRGKNINIPRDLFILNRVYVTSKLKVDNYDFKNEGERKDTCVSRSPEKKVYKIKPCCSPEQERLDYYCEARGVYLIQPMCWNCDLYKNK